MSAVNEENELRPFNTEARIAVMSVQIENIERSLQRIEGGNVNHVPRSEWEQRNQYVDLRFLEAFSQIHKVGSDAAARRAPWWTIVAAGAGALAVIAYLLDIVPQIVN